MGTGMQPAWLRNLWMIHGLSQTHVAGAAEHGVWTGSSRFSFLLLGLLLGLLLRGVALNIASAFSLRQHLPTLLGGHGVRCS
jgi:hypothetical protein